MKEKITKFGEGEKKKEKNRKEKERYTDRKNKIFKRES